MIHEAITYSHNGTLLEGDIFYQEDLQGKRPCVLVAHAWMGKDEFAVAKAQSLASLGYVGVAMDLYGDGKVAKSHEKAMGLIYNPTAEKRAWQSMKNFFSEVF